MGGHMALNPIGQPYDASGSLSEHLLWATPELMKFAITVWYYRQRQPDNYPPHQHPLGPVDCKRPPPDILESFHPD